VGDTLSTVSELKRLLAVIDRWDEVTVVLLGDLGLDRFILGTPKRISREAPVIILRHEGQYDTPGCGANALANLAALGVRALPVGAVGDDEPGQSLLQILSQRGVDTSGIITVPGFKTPTKVRLLGGGASSLKHQVARYDIEDSLPADGPWQQRLLETLLASTRHANAVAISDYGYGAVCPATVSELSSRRDVQLPLCLDSRFRLASFSGVDGATPNLQELEAFVASSLSSDEEVATAAEQLRRHLGARFLLATRGNRGMTLVEDARDPMHIPVYGTDQVADVTGAGDTVLAVLVAALAAGAEPADAANLANLAGGIVVMKLGTATVSRSELVHAVHHSHGGAAP